MRLLRFWKCLMKSKIVDFLKDYDGKEIKLMEVCGTHTSVIAKSGIRSLLSPKIRLISGPGCPVCVTSSAYTDKCLEYSAKENHVLLSFGDMLKGRFELMYTPFEAISKAESNPEITYVIAAVGFEATAAVYAQLLREAEKKHISNIKLLTAIKTIFPPLKWICENEKSIDGFICPGHVSVITGIKGYEKLCAEYGKPFVITGFEPEHILSSIYSLVQTVSTGIKTKALNLYKSAVKDEGNIAAQAAITEYFSAGSAVWRGIGMIENSGLYLREQYAVFDGGSYGLDYDAALPDGCRCGDVITGRINPGECPLFGNKCTHSHPLGPCMASPEGACGLWS